MNSKKKYFKKETSMSLSMIKTAPPVVSTEISKHFADGKIEIRGYYPDLYFKAEDIATYFHIPNLADTVLAEENGFQKGIHYQEYFVHVHVSNKLFRNQKHIFLTQIGMMIFLFIHRTNTTEPFQDMASKLMCCYQFGSIDEKIELAAELMGSKKYVLKDLFGQQGFTTTPSAYIFSIGDVGTLRETLSIDPKYSDKMVVCAYGCAPNIYTALSNFSREYPDGDIDIVASVYIDPINRTDAEKKLSSMLNIFKFGNDPLIIVPSTWTKKATPDILSVIHKRYAGVLTEISNMITQ